MTIFRDGCSNDSPTSWRWIATGPIHLPCLNVALVPVEKVRQITNPNNVPGNNMELLLQSILITVLLLS